MSSIILAWPMDKYSYISNAEVAYIDELYENYKNDPSTVDVTWQKFFEGFDFSQLRFGDTPPADQELSSKETQVRAMIHGYRALGHLKSDTNPVRPRRDHKVKLSIEDFGLSKEDLDQDFEVGKLLGMGKTSLEKIEQRLKDLYLGPIGYEYLHIRNSDEVDWFKQKIEIEGPNRVLATEEKKRLLSKLNEAVVFENFLHTKFLGQKRFSLEGGENTIPALDKIITRSSELGVEEVIIGMAHRGRLNVLANIMGKTYEEIFSEFEGSAEVELTMGDGDVKYHLGYASYMEMAKDRKIYVKLAPNPSHLEAVDPVVLGMTRAQIDDEYRGDKSKAIPILIHGDAAIAGQGVVYEIVQMSKLHGYSTGGTIHLVINNQVGFTTDYDDARSSIYCTDLAKIVDAPVLHVNGDDAEAINFAATMAVEYRQKFGGDFFIDLLCYRRHGHNESDEPKFTQPKLYNLIAKHPNPREVYSKRLVERGDVDAQLASKMDKEFRKLLQDRLNEVKQNPLPYKAQKLEEEWKILRYSEPSDFDNSPDTSIDAKMVKSIGETLISLPEGFKPLKQIERLLKDRKANFFEKKMLNWADAELLAYGSLLAEGKIVRMSGQDVKRGTFSHRHSYFFDANTNEPYCALDHVAEKQEPFRIYNSLLSEFGVLGFEYGYAMATPNALVLWEAQFGDFANGAQVMIDQFITSAESKWQRMNGLVILLPHGYEGQGPEHSNARPERYLQLAAEDNLVVANITTPANLFHLMRRQVIWEFRVPCVVFSPKSLLRHPKVISPVEEFTKGGFVELFDDDNTVAAAKVKKVLFCSGKIYYDLLEEKEKTKNKEVAIIRMEQLHPFPEKKFDAILKKYKSAKVAWVQEEPSNMGYWAYMLRIASHKVNFELVSRKASASPATGFAKIHKKEQEEIVKKAFKL